MVSISFIESHRVGGIRDIRILVVANHSAGIALSAGCDLTAEWGSLCTQSDK